MRAGGRVAVMVMALLLATAPVLAAEQAVKDERPIPGSRLGSDFPTIFARFEPGSSTVEPSTVRVLLDHHDVTASSVVSSSYVSYSPAQPLSNGYHTVEIRGDTSEGSPVEGQWSFDVDDVQQVLPVVDDDDFGTQSVFFPNFGFFPPGFSLFVPGPLFFVAGDDIIVFFVSELFPFGTGFFTTNCFPGEFPFEPVPDDPGVFMGRIPIPRGTFRTATGTIAAHFKVSNLGTVVVHGDAPVMVDATRTTLPPALHYVSRPGAFTSARSPAMPHALVGPNVLVGPRVENMPRTGTSGGVVRRPLPHYEVRVPQGGVHAPIRYEPMTRPYGPMTRSYAPTTWSYEPVTRPPETAHGAAAPREVEVPRGFDQVHWFGAPRTGIAPSR